MPEQIPFEDIYIPEGDFHIYDLQKAGRGVNTGYHAGRLPVIAPDPVAV
jgi:hypothetical protein